MLHFNCRFTSEFSGSLSSYAAEISDTLEIVPESQSSSENLTDIENDQPAQLPETDTVQSTEDSDTIPEEVEETLESEDFLEPEQDPTRDFVTRLYKVILLREPDTEGLNEWV